MAAPLRVRHHLEISSQADYAQLMWIRCSIQAEETSRRSTVPEQCWVPLARTDVVWMATVALSADCVITLAASNVIDRSRA
jgi:hypothetical protein